jgi:hypothetical protein
MKDDNNRPNKIYINVEYKEKVVGAKIGLVPYACWKKEM